MTKWKILLVDDDPDILETMVSIFEQAAEPLAIFQATNAHLALRIALKELPNLIITDWDMPSMTGIEFTKMIRKTPELEDVPIIMCSGVMTTSENLEYALSAGAVDYIRKPIDPIELIARSRSMLKLSDSYQKIKELNRTKDQIFSIISHDLRGPVGNLKTALDIIVDDPNDTDKDSTLNMARKYARNSFYLLENLLSWSRSQIKTLQSRPEMVDLQVAVDEVLEVYADEFDNKEINFHMELDSTHSPYADFNMVTLVVRNLISNAIKFTKKGGNITVRSSLVDNNIHFSVIDNGVGISSENIEKVLNPDTTYTTFGTLKEKGSGLGLLLCQIFIEKNQGKIWVESKENIGTTFTFSLPCRQLVQP